MAYQPGEYLDPIQESGESLKYDQEDYDEDIASNPYTYDEEDAPEAYAGNLHYYDSYASGNYSRANYRPPARSRSPTPAFDDDYRIVADGSVEYDGDAEKGGSFYAEGYPNSQYAPYSTYEFDTFANGEETPHETRHFGPAPVGPAIRRNKKRRVRLTKGNLVVDLDVPTRLVLPRRDPEFLKTRYSAVTCDPDDFEAKGFELRQTLMGRQTELFIVITMFNEDEILLCRTLHGVMKNISHLCTRKSSQTWGPEAWKKVVVCIVADGRRKINPRVLDCLTLLGVYQPGGPMLNSINRKEVTAHVFEYTTSFVIDENLKFRYPDKGIVPTQIIFCMKEKNQKKINSHRWFFNAFAPLLQPNVCVLLDVGTRPGPTAIYRLWKAFDVNSRVAGACGEISTYKGKNWIKLLNPLVAAQNFEYKISCILDKQTESMFGYISVLPGAFSAYRYIALQNNRHGIGPLASYFKGEELHGHDTDMFTSNMYLAEDRILCFELVAKQDSAWILKYVRGAVAETDVPDALSEFISQRRRWLNGSFFAAVYAIAHVGQILRSGHRYTIINLIFSWFSIGNLYISFVVLTSSLEAPYFRMPTIKYVNNIIQYLMVAVVIACFFFSMGNKPHAAKWKYKSAALALAAIMTYMVFASVMCALAAAAQGGSSNSAMLFSVIIIYGTYAASAILAFDPWHMLTSFIPYVLLSPTYINILNIYAFSNLDDISWGTKQDSIQEVDLGAVVQDIHAEVQVEMSTDQADMNNIYEEALSNIRNRKPAYTQNTPMSNTEKDQVAKDYYANVRTNVLLAWVLSNGVLLAGVLGGGADPSSTFSGHLGRTKGYLIFILVFTALQNLIRFSVSTLYLLVTFITG
ncbi:Chitin synthase [Mycena indigotica]|uniref:Chitin synthase n=1 Tax=Mycena indigotica TaxID=2126181 RepID=A0A8H6TBC7_9AGAR|nr:Chitin synthase [Mycena indigotica]KAF7315388.1 Chitin synthase [Mycena indigotica]